MKEAGTEAAGEGMRDILVVTRHFPPAEGGIQEYIYQRCLQDPERVMLLAASYPGDREFDRAQPFLVHRWLAPVRHPNDGIVGRLKQSVSSACLLMTALRLRVRYRYRYVEWGHGYDFPVLLVLSYLLKVRCLMCLHGHDLLCALGDPFQRRLFQRTLRRVERVVCNSGYTRDYLLRHQPERVAVEVVHPRMRAEKFGMGADEANWAGLRSAVRGKLGLGDAAVLVLSVGRLVPRKGFDQVIRLIPQLVAEGIDIHYVVCGQGEQKGALERLAGELGVAERVRLAGHASDGELGGYYAACDIFAMLTFLYAKGSSVEGYGIVYEEAGYFGKPVLAAAAGGAVEAVHHNENGLLVAPQDAREALEALRRLCRDGELRRRLGERGRAMQGELRFHFPTSAD